MKPETWAQREAILTEVSSRQGVPCACPGCDETNLRRIQIDHRCGGGNADRRAKKLTGLPYYRKVRAEGQVDILQGLCAGCHFEKTQYGYCSVHEPVKEGTMGQNDEGFSGDPQNIPTKLVKAKPSRSRQGLNLRARGQQLKEKCQSNVDAQAQASPSHSVTTENDSPNRQLIARIEALEKEVAALKNQPVMPSEATNPLQQFDYLLPTPAGEVLVSSAPGEAPVTKETPKRSWWRR
jgi:hypothetical protein